MLVGLIKFDLVTLPDYYKLETMRQFSVIREQ